MNHTKVTDNLSWGF